MAASLLHPAAPIFGALSLHRFSRRSCKCMVAVPVSKGEDKNALPVSKAEDRNALPSCTEDPWFESSGVLGASGGFNRAGSSKSKSACNVKLALEVQAPEHQRPYVVPVIGEDSSNLSPLPLQQHPHNDGLWEIDLEVPNGSSLEYAYFLRADASDAPLTWAEFAKKVDIPESGSSVPLYFRDSWSDSVVCGEEDPLLEEDPFLASAQVTTEEEEEVAELEEEEDSDEEIFETREPAKSSASAFRFFPKRKVFPREEPWLLESVILRDSHELVPTAKEIFINSSVCTMQRIAILENKQLVRLLLEPVKSGFQVGDVYLAVVRRVSPGINGVFVDLGSISCLVAVNMQHYPHIFQPSDEVAGEGASNVSSGHTSLLHKVAAWKKVRKGAMIIVQVTKEAIRDKGPVATAKISLSGRFLALLPLESTYGVSAKVTGLERNRLKQLAKELQPPGFGLIVRTEAAGHSYVELQKDLKRLLEIWENIQQRAEVAAAAGGKDPEPVLLQRAMGQTLRIVRDVFNNQVSRFVVDSSETYQEVKDYVQEIAPQLCDRVELYTGQEPLFEAFDLESKVEKAFQKRVELPDGAYLVLEETEALVSIDVNSGKRVAAGTGISHADTCLQVNLAAARQIALELRLRDIGGIIIVDFIDMENAEHHKLVVREMRKAISQDASKVCISEISEFGVMEITRARQRASITSTITDVCSCCGGTGRIPSFELTFSKIERAIKKVLIQEGVHNNGRRWPELILRVDPDMHHQLKSARRRVNQLCSALNVLLTIHVDHNLPRGEFHVQGGSSSWTRRQDI